jgi:hypothetical protein
VLCTSCKRLRVGRADITCCRNQDSLWGIRKEKEERCKGQEGEDAASKSTATTTHKLCLLINKKRPFNANKLTTPPTSYALDKKSIKRAGVVMYGRI